MLESRAGTPAWGPELLARHYLVGIEGNLDSFYGEWERWAADVAEESHHVSGVALHALPPPHQFVAPWELIAVLDSAALYMAVSPSAAPAEAKLLRADGLHLPQRHRPCHPYAFRPRSPTRRRHRSSLR